MLYLDWAAAAPPEPETLEKYAELLRERFANQESGHALGFALRREIEKAAESLSLTFWKRSGGGVVWGNSCTELFQLVAASPFVAGRRVVSSRLEHPALDRALRRKAGSITFLRAAPTGKLVPEPAEGAALVALHQVQSELGVVQDLPELFSAFPGAVRFVDAAQGAGKLKFPNADVVAISGAKLGVPGGGAALLLNPDWKDAGKFAEFAAQYRKEEHRIGRVHPALPPLLAFAARRRAAELENARRRIGALNSRLRSEVTGDAAFPTVAASDASPYILHLSTPKHQGAVLMRMLSEAGVAVSAGSACAAESKDPSPALLALGRTRREAYGGVRLSFGWDTPPEAADIFLAAWGTVLQNY